jgi:hypothetical protein
VLGASLPAAGISAPICTFGSLASAVVRRPRTVHQIYIFAGDNSTQSHRSQAVLERAPRTQDRAGDAPAERRTLGRVAIVSVDVEFVDEPLLLSHSRQECRLIEFVAEPGQGTGTPVLHHPE